MSLLMNILWIILGGFWVFLGYLSGGIALCFTIIGIPWGFQCFKLAIFSLFPFGSDTRARIQEPSSETLNLLANIVWLIFGGIWVVLGHLFWGIALCFTIIGIPFGLQHFKMMRLGFTPFGREIYDPEAYA
ncbi:YccF domain-containing protein [Pleionea litopenaei]|uniref:Inner membrane protein YccF n=1 Tax=Pleionea litopenaei TaxID=3070815 RepID=A0AA51X6T4_9GAMM|nr:YccF domain-containing protein [Pleionea sp. HL-JVS1]WMS86410.1 YccF domain-containing protein [Pleionea sp. HL-JVS1]